MVDCVKAVAAAVDSATTGMTHRLIKTSMFSISVQEANMSSDVSLIICQVLKATWRSIFFFIDDFVTVCQDRNIVIIVINFSNWGRHIVARTLDVGGNCESFFWKMKKKQ